MDVGIGQTVYKVDIYVKGQYGLPIAGLSLEEDDCYKGQVIDR